MYHRQSKILLIVLKLVTRLDLDIEEVLVAGPFEVEQEDNLYEVLQGVVDPTQLRQYTHLMQKTPKKRHAESPAEVVEKSR